MGPIWPGYYRSIPMRNLIDKAWDFCALGIATEEPMDSGMIRYRFNTDYECYRELTDLLQAVSRMHPEYPRAYRMREALWPERRATRERNRRRRHEP